MKWLAVLCVAFATCSQTPSTYDTGIGHGTPMLTTAQSILPDTLPGVVIEGWHYDPVGKFGGHAVTLHLVNHSNKDVTAFNISIAEKYADGTTDSADGTPNRMGDHQVMEDMLGQLTMEERRGGHGKAWFADGTSRDYVIPEAKDIADIETVVDVVAYADGTADVQNDRAFRNLVAERKGPLLAMQKTTAIIERVLADPMVSSPVAEVLRALTPLVADAEQSKNRPPEDPELFEAMYLRNNLKDFQTEPTFWSRLTKTNEREWLARYVEKQEKQIALMKPHCELVINK